MPIAQPRDSARGHRTLHGRRGPKGAALVAAFFAYFPRDRDAAPFQDRDSDRAGALSARPPAARAAGDAPRSARRLMAPHARLLLPTEIAVGAITITARRRPERARLLRGAFPRRRAPVPHQARRALEDGVLLVQGRAALLPVVVPTRIRVHHITRVRRSLSSSLRPRPLAFQNATSSSGAGPRRTRPPNAACLATAGWFGAVLGRDDVSRAKSCASPALALRCLGGCWFWTWRL